MRCPFCHADNDRVIDSRASQEGYAIRRRRECLGCKRRYTTYENIEDLAIKVVKKDGSRVPLDREKIRRGLERACWKRPVSDDQIEAVVSAVEHEVFTHHDSEVESRVLGDLVMKHLRELDQVAFVRFASVYREFKDARDFAQVLQHFLGDKKKTAK
jgi:transcriptional repressor NrdR